MIMSHYFYDLTHFRGQGRNPCNFWFAFWEKPHKFILNLTGLYTDMLATAQDKWTKLETSNTMLYCMLIQAPSTSRL